VKRYPSSSTLPRLAQEVGKRRIGAAKMRGREGEKVKERDGEKREDVQ
jgi:hypothetical protein